MIPPCSSMPYAILTSFLKSHCIFTLWSLKSINARKITCSRPLQPRWILPFSLQRTPTLIMDEGSIFAHQGTVTTAMGLVNSHDETEREWQTLPTTQLTDWANTATPPPAPHNIPRLSHFSTETLFYKCTNTQLNCSADSPGCGEGPKWLQWECR